MSKISDFFDSIKNKKIAMIGVGVSHNDLIKMFRKKELDVTICDKRTKEDMGEIYNEFEAIGCKFSLGDNYLDEIYNSDIVFRTPGMYYLSDALTRARKMGVIVTSEMEVFFDLCPCKIIATTGTDGKTTTTTIMTEILERSGKKVHKGGNIGRALLPIIEDISPDDIAVVELSSFQLISMRKSPDTAVITNIYPDHLNVHKDMAEYVNAKANLLNHQNAFSKTILNEDNETSFALSENVRGTLFTFSAKHSVERGAYLKENGMLCYVKNGVETDIINKSEIKIPGMHNVENYLTAISALFDECNIEAIRETARNFGGVEHRIEYVRTIDGVKYYNDSIATSPVSVIAGLNAFGTKVILIAGGSDKKLDYNLIAQPISENVKVLVLTGATADKIETAVRNYEKYDENSCKIVRANNMEEAVKLAKENAVSGDIVTLSPASASFDCYKNFEERGKHYKSIVNSL